MYTSVYRTYSVGKLMYIIYHIHVNIVIMHSLLHSIPYVQSLTWNSELYGSVRSNREKSVRLSPTAFIATGPATP